MHPPSKDGSTVALLGWLSPCRSPRLDQVFCGVALCFHPALLWSVYWSGRSLVLTSNRPTTGSGVWWACCWLHAQVPGSSTKPSLGQLFSGLVVSLARSNRRPSKYEGLGPWFFHQAKTGSAVCWSSSLHAEAPGPSTKPRLGHLGWWVCCLPTKVSWWACCQGP